MLSVLVVAQDLVENNLVDLAAIVRLHTYYCTERVSEAAHSAPPKRKAGKRRSAPTEKDARESGAR